MLGHAPSIIGMEGKQLINFTSKYRNAEVQGLDLTLMQPQQ
jgi:hypothetical protein